MHEKSTIHVTTEILRANTFISICGHLIKSNQNIGARWADSSKEDNPRTIRGKPSEYSMSW